MSGANKILHIISSIEVDYIKIHLFIYFDKGKEGNLSGERWLKIVEQLSLF